MPATRTSPRKGSQTIQLTLTGKPVSVMNPRNRKGKASANRVFTDVVLTIKPEFVKLLAAQTKNHEYRKYKLRDTVERIWLYETAPTSAITFVPSRLSSYSWLIGYLKPLIPSGLAHRHIIGVGAPRVPGEVNDPSGIGNDEFDAGQKVSKYGYPVKGMYRLPKPLTSAALKERYGISPPQGYMYAPEALVQGEPLNAMEILY